MIWILLYSFYRRTESIDVHDAVGSNIVVTHRTGNSLLTFWAIFKYLHSGYFYYIDGYKK